MCKVTAEQRIILTRSQAEQCDKVQNESWPNDGDTTRQSLCLQTNFLPSYWSKNGKTQCAKWKYDGNFIMNWNVQLCRRLTAWLKHFIPFIHAVARRLEWNFEAVHDFEHSKPKPVSFKTNHGQTNFLGTPHTPPPGNSFLTCDFVSVLNKIGKSNRLRCCHTNWWRWRRWRRKWRQTSRAKEATD